MNDDLEIRVRDFYNQYFIHELLGKDEISNLYHYTSINPLLDILKNSKLRFSNRHFLNDETEGKYIFQLCQKNISEVCPPNITDFFNNFCDEMIKKMEHELLEDFQIYQLSFSTEKDSLTLWNYYAKQTGCSLEFDKISLINSLRQCLVTQEADGRIFMYGEVIYEKKKQLSLIKKVISDYLLEVGETNLGDFKPVLMVTLLRLGTFFKHPGFKDEHEYRIVYDLYYAFEKNDIYILETGKELPYRRKNEPLAIKNSEGIPYKIDTYYKEGMLVPYVDIDFSPSALKSIKLSPTSNSSLLTPGIQIAAQTKFGHIERNNIDVSEIPIRF